MTTTTSYGTWCNRVDQYSTTVEHSVAEAFGSEGDSGFDFDAIVRDYRTAINAALPDGVSLCGNDFIGPYDSDTAPGSDGDLDIKGIVDGVDLAAIMEAHVIPEGRRYTVVVEVSDEAGELWQAAHPSENACGDSAAEVARWVATNQTVAEGGGWRVRVWAGHDADTKVGPAAEYYPPAEAEEN